MPLDAPPPTAEAWIKGCPTAEGFYWVGTRASEVVDILQITQTETILSYRYFTSYYFSDADDCSQHWGWYIPVPTPRCVGETDAA